MVSDIFVAAQGDYTGQKAILQDNNATITGVFVGTTPTDKGIENAIIHIIKRYGKAAGPQCPQNNIQHWGKIIFKIIRPDLAKRLNVPANSVVDIET